MRHTAPELTLYASYSKAAIGPDKPHGFTLDIDLPSPIAIHLGRGITTDPISLQLQTSSPFTLDITSGLKVPVAKSPQPLDFHMTLSITGSAGGQPPTVNVSASMDGYWVDPFGLGDQVRIGNELLMNLGIILPQFFVTGVPSEFGFKGGIAVGDRSVQMAVSISEDPERMWPPTTASTC